MFHNREDIEYFMPVKLRTRCGRLGHIKESLGKCNFQRCRIAIKMFFFYLMAHFPYSIQTYRYTWTHEMRV